MRKDIFKKFRIISKSGFLASSLLNIGAMNSGKKINNKNSINLTNNLKINNIKKQEINDEQILELFRKSLNKTLDEYINNCKNTNISPKFVIKKDFFHSFIILSKIFNTDSYEKESTYNKIKCFHRILHEKDFLDNFKNLNDFNDIDTFLNISNFGIFKYESTIKNFDQNSQSYYFFNQNKNPNELFTYSGCWEEKFFENKFNENLNNLSDNIIDEINSLIKEIIGKGFRISKKIYNNCDPLEISKKINKENKIKEGKYIEIDEEEKKYLKKFKNYYFMFYSINFIIDYFKNNFPNIYNFHELFLKKAKLNKFSIKDAKEYEDNSFDGKCNVFTKNIYGQYVPFSIYFNTENILKKDSNLEIFTIVVHEFCHFIINTFSYTILKECEIEYKPSESKQLGINKSNQLQKLKKLEYILFSKLKDILNDKKQFENGLKKVSCYLSNSYKEEDYLELLTCCLSDYIMNGVFDNIDTFIKSIINVNNDNEELKNLKTEFFFNKDKIHEEITFNFSNEKIINSSTEIGKNLFKFLKNYDKILTKAKVDEILKEVEDLEIEEDKTNYIEKSDLKD